MNADSDLFAETARLQDQINDPEIVSERRIREWSDGARYIHWVGIVLVGGVLVGLLNATPPRWTDPLWQLNLISLVLSNGDKTLLGAMLICLASLFNRSDNQIKKRALLVRTLASWVALGWFLLIPLQLVLGVRVINAQAAQEVDQIQAIERTSRAVANATNESELRAAMAQVPNQPPLPRLIVPLEVAKANLLGQFQRNINTAKNQQQEKSSTRWQTWLKEVIRNCLMSLLLSIGFLALAKNRQSSGVALNKSILSTRRRS